MAKTIYSVETDLGGQFRQSFAKALAAFNLCRGRRKERNPKIKSGIIYPGKKFGRCIEMGDSVMSEDILQRFVAVTLRTLLHRKPIPSEISLDVFERDDTPDSFTQPKSYLFRMIVPKRKKDVRHAR